PNTPPPPPHPYTTLFRSVNTVTASGEATPIARIGLERISRKTDIIPTEKLNQILVGSAKARILNEVKTLACTNCWKYVEMRRVKDRKSTRLNYSHVKISY